MLTFNADRAELLFCCFFLHIFSFSFISSLFQFSSIFFIGPINLFFVLTYLSLNQPEETSVDRILGLNPRFQLRNADISSDFADFTAESYFSIAYRSAPFDSTKNNLNAVLQCARNGCKVIHVDVEFTSDNVAVITRDTIVLIKNGDDILTEKYIEDCTFNEIKQNAVRDELMEITRETIPTLDEVVATCRTSNVKLVVNLIQPRSDRWSTNTIVSSILDLFEKNEYLYESCLVSCGNPYLLFQLRSRNANIITALRWRGYSQTSASSVSWLKNNAYVNQLRSCITDIVDTSLMWILKSFIYRLIGLSVIILPKEQITSNVVEFWEKRKVRCIASVVNLPAEKMYYENALAISYLTETVIVPLSPVTLRDSLSVTSPLFEGDYTLPRILPRIMHLS